MSVYPSPTPDNGSSSTPTTIDVNILPAEANGAPVSYYYIVVEEVDANPVSFRQYSLYVIYVYVIYAYVYVMPDLSL